MEISRYVIYCEFLLFFFNFFKIYNLNELFNILLYLHIFITVVLPIIKCNKYSKLQYFINYVIKIFIFIILFKFNIKFNIKYIIVSLFLIYIYYILHDISKEYRDCPIPDSHLIKSLLITTIIYVILYFITNNCNN